MAKTKLVKFNIKNVKYAMPTTNGWGAVADLAYATAISLEADYDEQRIYGDGQVIGTLPDDKGLTGTLSVVGLNKDYEIACGRAMEIESGLADVETKKAIPHALYFEVDGLDDGVVKTYKTWLIGVITGKASESYTQTEADPTISGYDHALTVLGTNLKTASGTGDYTDANGNTIKVFKVSAAPSDTDYATFGNSVPAIKAKNLP